MSLITQSASLAVLFISLLTFKGIDVTEPSEESEAMTKPDSAGAREAIKKLGVSSSASQWSKTELHKLLIQARAPLIVFKPKEPPPNLIEVIISSLVVICNSLVSKESAAQSKLSGSNGDEYMKLMIAATTHGLAYEHKVVREVSKKKLG